MEGKRKETTKEGKEGRKEEWIGRLDALEEKRMDK